MVKNFSKVGWTVSLFFAALYLICIAWGFLFINDPELMTLHGQLLALAYPGFVWISAGSFFLGLVLSVVYGWVGAGLYVLLHNMTCCNGEKSGCCK
ncbi:MAG: hypothetical protein Q8P68_00160 [Candidatus Peregrinibacteria bacterium]|nr:hypothetical protein [Candidatus Peregrinibacteria bacterium]MDZ4244614.1 hypothetical protein [Candidatus Gracilibacteria bacterium]